MPEFPVTFDTYDDDTKERRFSDDWWAWVRTQPQDAMLLWLRSSNWDNVRELWFVELIKDPETDLAIIAVIFWGNSSSITAPGYIPAMIIGNIEKGYYQQSELWLDRNQFIDKAMMLAKRLREGGRTTFQYPFPRNLLGPFGRRKASVPSKYSKQVEEQISLVEEKIEINFHRSEDEYLANRYKRSFRNETLEESELRLASLQQPLPSNPVSTFASLSDLDYLERYFLSIDVYDEFRRDPDEHNTQTGNERASIFTLVSAIAGAAYAAFALLLWLTGAFSKSDKSHFGAVFALSVMAVLIIGGLAVLWREMKR